MTRPFAQYSREHVLIPYTIFVSTSQRGLKQTSTIRVNHWTWPLSKVKRLVNTRYTKLPPANTTRWLPWKGFWCCCGLPVLEEANFNTINSATAAQTNKIRHAHDQHCVLRTHGCLYYTFTYQAAVDISISVKTGDACSPGRQTVTQLMVICHSCALLLCWPWLTELSIAMTLFTVRREKNWWALYLVQGGLKSS